jgi:hypothetical protein
MTTTPQGLAQPATLGEAGAAFWTTVTGVYEDLTPTEATLLEQSCRSLDAIAVLDAAAAADPIVVGSKGQPIPHPAFTEARLQRRELARQLDQLGLPDPTGASEAVPSSMQSRKAKKAAESRWARRDARRAVGGPA